MIIQEDTEKTSLLMSALRESFRETRGRNGDTAVHLSDLLYPRKSFFGRTTDELPTETEVLYWAAGRAHEDILARLAGMVVSQPPVLASVPGLIPGEPREAMGISYRPDFRWYTTVEVPNKNEVWVEQWALPAEMKTTRWSVPLPGEESSAFEGYLEQLRGYCLLDEVTQGYLIVFFLHAPALVVYRVEFTESEIARKGSELLELRMAHQEALLDKTHKKLPLCPETFCGTRKKYEIAPAHCLGCGKDMSAKSAEKHSRTKKGQAHIIRPPITGWFYKPKCKYYDACRPFETDELRKQW